MKLICNKHGASEHSRTGVKIVRYKCLACTYDYTHSYLRRLKQKAVDYAGGACVECGYNKSVQALHFHHIDSSTKEFAIFESRGGKKIVRDWDKLVIEIDKCVLLCANCHAELHHVERNESDSNKPQSIELGLSRTQLAAINRSIIERRHTIEDIIERLSL